jgi:two-component system chemotaxis response regulator CheB
LKPGPAIPVAIVDDSALVRGLLAKWLGATPGIEVVGQFGGGREIIDAVGALKPRIVLLDLSMPDMDGMTALPQILARGGETRVIVVSSLSRHGAELTVRALMLGAADYLPKPSSQFDAATSVEFRAALVAKVLAVGAGTPSPVAATTPAHRAYREAAVASMAQAADPGNLRALRSIAPSAIMIGASTGGPQALLAMLNAMRSAISRIPIVIAQHMPPIFASTFAQHLRDHGGFPTREVQDGMALLPGTLYLAPGGCHSIVTLRPDGRPALALRPAEIRGPWRPSIDLLFGSAAEVFGEKCLALALTGMGRDGTEGARTLAEQRANILVQDEASSVVWGIPGSIAEAGLASAMLSPQKLGELAVALVEGRTR